MSHPSFERPTTIEMRKKGVQPKLRLQISNKEIPRGDDCEGKSAKWFFSWMWVVNSSEHWKAILRGFRNLSLTSCAKNKTEKDRL